MENVFIDEVLSGDLKLVPLRCLYPDEKHYSIMFYQPCGEIDAQQDFVGNKCRKTRI